MAIGVHDFHICVVRRNPRLVLIGCDALLAASHPWMSTGSLRKEQRRLRWGSRPPDVLFDGSGDASIMLAGESMATLTIRNVPDKVAKSLKTLARKNRRSMEQEVRELISEHVGERVSVLDQIQAAWRKQARRPTASEVEGWLSAGRE